MQKSSKIILGIDPGTVYLGYGVIKSNGHKLTLISLGTIDLSKYAERMKGFTKAYDVATGVTFNLEPKLTLGEKYLLVMELKK